MIDAVEIRETVAERPPEAECVAGAQRGHDGGQLADDLVADVNARGKLVLVEDGIEQGKRPGQQGVGSAAESEHDELAGLDRGRELRLTQAQAIGSARQRDIVEHGRVTLDQGGHACACSWRGRCSETFCRAASSVRVRRRVLPVASPPICTGPMAMRRSRSTLCPSRASMRRISRFLPSLRTMRSQVLSPCFFSRLTRRARTWPSLSQIPVSSFCTSSLVGLPATWARYVFSTPKRGCSRRLARSPSLVKRSRPSLASSSRPMV